MSTSIPYVSGTTTFTTANYTSAGSPANVTLGDGWTIIGGSAFQNVTGLKSITIPNSVTTIETRAFQGATGLTSITIPSSVRTISSHAFSYASGLTSITIPSSVTSFSGNVFSFATGLKTAIFPSSISSIPISTFYKATGLTSFTIPSSVKSIGDSAFSYATSLTSIIIPNSVTNIDRWAFYGSTGLTSLTLSSSITKIGIYMFYDTRLTSITIPNSVTIIEESAFQLVSTLTSITIPSSVTFIGLNAFERSGITTATFEESTILDGLAIIPGIVPGPLYGKSGITVSWITKVFNGSGSLSGATALLYGATSVRIATYTSIGASAFLNASGVTSITIPSSVTSIGGSAFQGSGITTATFEESTILDGLGITSGPDKTLYDKSSMSIYLSYKVFNGTGQLTSTIVNDNGLSYVRNLTITGFSSIEANAFQYVTFLTSITIPSSVTSIGTNAFLNSGLTRATFTVNTDVSTVGSTLSNTPQTFFGKTGVTVSALDTKIFSGSAAVALSGATALLDEKTNVVIEGYTNIGESAFLNASNITSVTIPNGVTTIANTAFQNATSLTSITIPASVTSISTTSVFQNTLSLTSINVDPSNNTYSSDNGVLYDKNKTQLIQYPVGNTQTSYIIPSTVTSIIGNAFYGAKNLKSVTLPDTSTFVSIGSTAFQGATGLESITIPSNVTNIGDYAFHGTTSLTTVNYAGTSMLKTIGGYAFQHATALTSITIPASVTSISANTVFLNALSLTSINVDPNNLMYSSDSYGVLYNFAKTTMLQYPVGSSQTSYTIPNTMTVTFNWYMFQGANNLKSVILPSNFTNIATYAFAGATGLESITIPSTVTNIGNYAFLGATSLKTVTFTGTSALKIIGQSAFQNATSLTSINIPASVTSISATSVFQNALSLTSIIVDPSNTTYYSDNGVLYNNPSKNTLIQYPVGNTQTSYTILSTVTTINSNAFYGANNLKSVTLPDTSTFTSIGSSAFYYATGLTSITIPPSVTIINTNAFFGATSLTTVTFAEASTLQTIATSAFHNATSLTSITIPASVLFISTTNVFQNTTSLTSINVDPSNNTYSDISGVLYDINKTQLIQYPLGNTQTSYAIPSSVASFSSINAFNGAKNLTAITCDPTSTILSTDSFGVLYNASKTYMYQYPCGNTRTSYTIPSTVTNTSFAFQSAKYLQSINVDPMNTIYSSDSNGVLFNKAKTNLIQYPLGNTQTTYSIPVNVTNISTYSFQDVTNLTSVTIQTPINGTTIQDYAFQNATSLKTITIPNSVISIGLKTFQGSGLTSAKFESAINYPTFAIQNKNSPQYFLGKENVVANSQLLVLNGTDELTYNTVNNELNDASRRVFIYGYSSIGANAFQDATTVTYITIPSSVTRIGASAFQGMTGLTTISIPSSVTSIGLSAFLNSGITSATFETTTHLNSLNITNGPNKTLYGKSGINVYLSSNVLNGSGQLTSTLVNDNNLSYVRNLTITGFSSIEENAFQGATGLTSITIPSSVTSIGANAFQDALGLTSITIPSSVTSIGANAFLNSGLTRAIFTVNTDVSTVGSTLSNTPQPFFGKTGVTVSALDTKIFTGSAAVALSGATALLDEKTNVVIEGFTNIGANAFQNASNITSVTIPNGVTTIANNAFQNATSLTSITIPASVTTISAVSVFQNALSLTSINIDPSNNNFSSDNGVLYDKNKTQLIQYPVGNTQTSYIIPSTVTSISSYAFYGANNLKSITLPSASTFVIIDLYAFQGATGLESITIPSNVTSIGSSAFLGATSLKTVTFTGTSTLKTIGQNAFQNATSLTSITIPASVTSISTTSVFQNALSLTSIIVDPSNTYYYSDNGVLYKNPSRNTLIQYPVGNTQTSYIIPSTVTTINVYAFYGANNLKSVTLPDTSTFTRISSNAFEGATGLTSITIPPRVTIIDPYAFRRATSLTTVNYAGTPTLKTIGDYAFQNATSLTSITIPRTVNGIGTSAFLGATGLTSIIVDPSNTYFYSDNGVLYNNPSRNTLIQYPVGNTQTSYIIPTTVTAINSNAFYGANNLKSVTLPDTSTFTSIASNAFYYATGLTSITIPPNVTAINSNAFFGATSLTTVTFAETPKLTTIGSSAFQNATSLTSITIPRTVNSINSSGVFQNTTSLTSIIVDPSNTSFSDISGVLYNAAKNSLIQYPLGNTQTSYTIPSSVTGFASTNVFQGAKYLTNFTSNSSNYSTDSYGVLYNSSKRTLIQYPCGNTQTSYTIPSMVTNISTYAFQLAKYLQSINVDPMNTTYSSYSNGVLFNKAKTNLIQYPLGNTQTTYSIPVNVTNISSYAFQNVTNLTSVTIQTPINGTTIQDYAFQNATSLNTITIPNSVTSIGFKTFQGSGLTSAKFESAINYPVYAIQNKSTPQYFLGKENVVASIILPYLVLNGSGELTSTIVSSILNNYSTVIIITGYSSIGTSAFLNATGLTSIIIPSSVTSIGTSAFENTDLTTVFFESASTVKKLGLLNGDLINGYTVSSFYGKASVTFIYTKAVRSTISAAPTAIIRNNTFTSLLTNMGMNISNMTSQVIPITNDPYIEYSAKLTIPNGNLSTLSDVNKANIIDTVKSLYAAQLGINLNKIIVTLESGSIIANVNVLKDGITDAMVPICFPKGTPVTTNQGVIAIEQLNPDIHTIRGKKIVAITQTKPNFEHIIAIDKNALGKNVPSASIQISKEHKVCYKREMVKANDLVEVCEGVRRIPYNGETLYNVLMEKHDKMMINNLICETLDPDNIMAKICGGKYNRYEQSNICKELNDIIKENNVKAYIKLYDSLK